MHYLTPTRIIFILFPVDYPISFDVSSRNCVLAMVFSYSFDSAIRLTLDEAQGKAQEYVLFVSTIASLLEHCASTPFRRFVANTLPPTLLDRSQIHTHPACFTRTRSPFLPFLRRLFFYFLNLFLSRSFIHLHLPLSLSLSLSPSSRYLTASLRFAHYRTGKRRFLYHRYRPLLAIDTIIFYPSTASSFSRLEFLLYKL